MLTKSLQIPSAQVRIAIEPNCHHIILSVSLCTGQDSSTYELSVNCSSGGLYEALYRDAGGSCLHKCSYFVEVEEVRIDVIRDVFSIYRELHIY